MARWPEDNPRALKAFYGDPGRGEVESQLVTVIPPFKMNYEGKPIKGIRFHRKAAPALRAALDQIWEHYGRDQKKIDALGISKFSGSYNHRLIRGSKTKWSNHAYGAAIDLNAGENGLYAKGNMPRPVIDAFEAQGAFWGGNYSGRKDPMHFEFCYRPERPVGFGDMAQVGDNGEDGGDAADGDEGDAPKTFWEKAKNWLLGGGGAAVSGLGYLGDVPPVVWFAIIAAGVFLVIYFNPPRWLRRR